MVAVQTKFVLTHAKGKKAEELLPFALLVILQQYFSCRELNYISKVLSVDELRVIGDLHDSLIVARIKRMLPSQIAHYDHFLPKNEEEQKRYNIEQLEGLEDEEWLLGTRCLHRPNSHEFVEDFLKCKNGIRFRAYYCLKYPERMRHNGKCGACKPKS